MKLRNTPGEPIVTRDHGARFYCIACFKMYQKCRCRVYMAADTLPAIVSPKPEQNAKNRVPRYGWMASYDVQ